MTQQHVITGPTLWTWTPHEEDVMNKCKTLLCSTYFGAAVETPFSHQNIYLLLEKNHEEPKFNKQTVLQTWNKYPLWCLCLMAPERTLAPASVRGALLSQVTLIGCPGARCCMGMEGRGPCEVRRRICVTPIVPIYFFRCTKDLEPPNVRHTEQYNPVLPVCLEQKKSSAVPSNLLMLSA